MKLQACLLSLIGFGVSLCLSGAEIPGYGVCAHLNRMPEAEMKQELDAMGRFGVNLVRVDMDWKQIAVNKNEWDFSVWDKVVNSAAEKGIRIIAILGGELPTGMTPYRNQKEFLDFVSACVERYKGKIAFYEVVNEADCDRPWGEKPDPEHYAELLKKTYGCIKKIDPGAQVLFSGVSFVRNPFPFLEKAFAAGAGQSCDALNFHPYQWKFVPEAQLRNKVVELRALMRKYGVDKPVWLTEIGNSSGMQETVFVRDVLAAALEKLQLKPEEITIGAVRDDDFLYYADGIHFQVADILPTAKKIRRPTLFQLRNLNPDECPVVLLPGLEGFPARMFGFVRDYVKRGGTVIVAGGVPFYFAVEKQPNGMFSNAWLTPQCQKELHFGWEASWTRKGVPANARKMVPGEEFPGLQAKRQFWTGRFLTAENLSGNDRMIPIFYGVEGNYRGAVAALYRFDSDLKGNLILLPGILNECSSEEMQASLLTRQYLLLRAENVAGICYYRFRAGEWNNGREAHFGIVRRNFEPKPAALAMKNLETLCPASVTEVKLSIPVSGIFTASWSRPGTGNTITALWTASDRRTVRISGTFGAAWDNYGKSIAIPSGETVLTPSPIFLEGKAGETPGVAQ